MNQHKPASLSEQVFSKIESDILSGVYKRGDILTEIGLSNSLGVSRTPVREALRMLEKEDLIEESSRGIVVIGITNEDIEDIFNIRLKIESDAAYLAAKNMSEEEIKELYERLELHEFYAMKKDADRMKEVDSEFHNILYRGSGSITYYNILKLLHKKAQSYRKASVSNEDRAKISALEHREIYEAIADRNPEKARAAAEKHVKNAAYKILKGDK